MRELHQSGAFSVVEGGCGGHLLVICAEGLTAEEYAVCSALPAGVEVELASQPVAPSLAVLCHRCAHTLVDTVVIATRPHDLPLLLEAHRAIALKDAGYENEAAADRVFPSRAAGGLVKAIRYVGALVAGR